MHIVGRQMATRIIPLFIAVVAAFIIGGSFTTTAYAADQIQPKAGGCNTSAGITTGFSSPFSVTDGMCLGDSGNNQRHYQFVVTITVPIKVVEVTGHNDNGKSITFRRSTQNTNQYVSDTINDNKGLGYTASTAAGCNVNDPVNNISIRATGGSGIGNNQYQDFKVNLCSNAYYSGDTGSFITNFSTTNLVGDDGTKPPLGTLLGHFGITRASAPAGTQQNVLLNTAGVKSIKITGPKNLSGDSVDASWYKLSNGELTLNDGLPPGLYSLEMHYDDCRAIPANQDWTSCDIPIIVRDFKMTAGVTTNIPNSDGSVQYYDKDGKATSAISTVASVSTCKVDGVGWIVCPIMRLMSQIVDAAYGFVSSLLKVQPLMTTGDTKDIYNAWSTMRNFANVTFVIAFLVIIFSQLTSIGLNNYGIKKMLPRLIIAAILVNVSYWICSIAVDISNILGYSLNNVMHGIVDHGTSSSVAGPGSVSNADGSLSSVSTGTGWVGIAGFILAGTIGTGIALYVGLSALLPALIVALLAIVTVFLVLTLRQALIILLVVISPLAFVAYLLPNTESLFKKWRELFQTLLLMYPIIAFLFGASAVASGIVMHSATGDYKIAIQIMGALIAIIPLALTPLIMKTAGGVLGKFGGIVNNPNKGPFDRMRKGAASFRERREKERGAEALRNGGGFGLGKYQRVARRKARSQAADSSMNAAEAGFGLTDNKTRGYAQQNAVNQAAISAANSAQNARANTAMIASQNSGAIAALGAAGQQADVAEAIAAQVTRATAEAIKEIKLTSDIAPGDLEEMGEQYKQAIASGDSIKARAMQDMLLGSGGAGIKQWRKSVGEAEAIAGPISGQMGTDLRRHMLDNQPGIKAQDASAMAWATKNGTETLDSLRGQAASWKLTNEEFAGQKSFAQLDAIQSGALTAQAAKEIMDNKQLFDRIDGSSSFQDSAGNDIGTIKQMIETLAGQAPTSPQPTTATTPVAQQPTTSQISQPTVLNVPHTPQSNPNTSRTSPPPNTGSFTPQGTGGGINGLWLPPQDPRNRP